MWLDRYVMLINLYLQEINKLKVEKPFFQSRFGIDCWKCCFFTTSAQETPFNRENSDVTE